LPPRFLTKIQIVYGDVWGNFSKRKTKTCSGLDRQTGKGQPEFEDIAGKARRF